MALSTIQNNSFADTAVHGFRNLVINGDMRIAQRGTSLTGITSSSNSTSFLIDRVKFYNANAGPTYTVTQEQDAPDGFRYSWKLETTTANASPSSTHYSILRTGLFEYNNVEGLQWSTSSAKSLTVSFWVKSSITGTQDVIFARHGSVQRHIASSFTINVANTWEYKTFTIVGDTGGDRGSDLDYAHAWSMDLFLYAGSNYTSGTAPSSWVTRSGDNARAVNNLGIGATTNATFQITGLQMEIGSEATPFEHRSYGDELARCKRYFERLNFLSTDYVLQGQTGGATTTANGLLYYTEKRTAPTVTLPPAGTSSGTITFLNPTGGYPSSTGSHIIQVAGPKQCRVYGSGYTGLTAGSNSILFSTGTTSVDVDAEL
jgi:hypothetical protein